MNIRVIIRVRVADIGFKGVDVLRKGHGLGLGVGLVYCTCVREWVFYCDVI